VESLFCGGIYYAGGAVRCGVRLLALGVLKGFVIEPQKQPEAGGEPENEDE
jgi:hypothetical protein